MLDTTVELKNNLERTGALLARLRDEARVEAHLAGMDLRDGWHQAERVLRQAEHAGRRIAKDVAQVVERFMREVRTKTGGKADRKAGGKAHPSSSRLFAARDEARARARAKAAAKWKAKSAHRTRARPV